MNNIIKIKLVAITIFLIVVSCSDDFLDTNPGNQVSQEQIDRTADIGEFSNVTSASINGMIANTRLFTLGGNESHDYFGQKAIDLSTDLTGQDMVQITHHWFGFDYLMENRNASFRRTNRSWNYYYTQIKSANQLLRDIPEETEDPLLIVHRGQAYAYRAYSYFYLARLYQHTYQGNENAPGVPLYHEDDSEAKPRAPLSEVYSLIVSDLENAINLLEGYSRQTKEQIDQSVAYGLLANVHLEMGSYAEAASAAKNARASYSLMDESQWLAGFNNINNPEWMWGSDINGESSTLYASFFSHMSTTSPGYAGALAVYKLIDKSLYDKIPETDYRKKAFVSPDSQSEYPAYANLKFRDETFFTADYVYMRVSEMYLIEAEALALSGDEAGAKQVFAELGSARDSAFDVNALSGQELIESIRLNKRVELWGEGRTFFDFKRWNKGVTRDYDGSNHRADAKVNVPAGSKLFVYQIPEKEFETNKELTVDDQNP